MRRVYWSPDSPVPGELRFPKTVVVLDSCALFLLFHPETADHLRPGDRREIREKLVTLVRMGGPTTTIAIVFDFILYETEKKEERIFGEKTARNSLEGLNVFLVKTGIRGLDGAARTIDLLHRKHRVLKRFRSLHQIDCALITCTERLFEEGLNVYIATLDRAMTELLRDAGIGNFFEVCRG